MAELHIHPRQRVRAEHAEQAEMGRRILEDMERAERERRVAEAAQARAQSRERMQFFRSTLSQLFSAYSTQKLPNIELTKLLLSAECVHQSRYGSKSRLPSVDELGMTYVIKDEKSHPDKAIIVCYDHHVIESLKSIIASLNGVRHQNPELTPRIDYCTNLYAQGHKNRINGPLVDVPSGRMLVVSNFDRLNLDKIRGSNSMSGCENMRELYTDIVRQLKAPAPAPVAAKKGWQAPTFVVS